MRAAGLAGAPGSAVPEPTDGKDELPVTSGVGGAVKSAVNQQWQDFAEERSDFELSSAKTSQPYWWPSFGVAPIFIAVSVNSGCVRGFPGPRAPASAAECGCRAVVRDRPAAGVALVGGLFLLQPRRRW